MTSTELKKKLKAFEDVLDDYGQTLFKGKDLWDLRNEIFEDFKTAEFEDRSERQATWQFYQDLIATLKAKQQDINRLNEGFTERAESKIQEFDNALNGDIFRVTFSHEDLQEFRKLRNETFELIKQSKWSSRERREKGWEKFNACRDQLKTIEDEYFTERRKKHEQRLVKSEELRDQIMQTIEACRPDSPIEDLIIVSAKVLSWLTPLGPVLAGIGFLYKAFEIGMGIEEEKPKSPLRVKSDALRDIRKFIQENRDDLNKVDRMKIYSLLDEVKEELDDSWSEFKNERERKQREWRENQEDFLTRLEERLEKQISYKAKLESHADYQEEYLGKLELRLKNQKEYLETLEDDLENLEEQYDDAYSDNFRDRVASRIESKKDKICEVENDIEIIESKIENIDDDRDYQEKINNVELDIENLEEKIKEVRRKLDD